ncbi:MAG: hypothetical protein MUF78_11540 [Candidatus Edwardsbacteria bacterium]|jgi:hypothetical protein|nr:hypothetical protein [Candidatus Edwardsbacteria bacterium]
MIVNDVGYSGRRPDGGNVRTITLLAAGAFFAGSLYAMVGPTDLDSLVGHADRIVIGTTIGIIEIDSTKIAKVHIERYITKAEKHDTVFILAQPTWQCDISDAKVGERCLWFLEDMTSRLTRKERKAFFQGRPYNKIEYHGRGRMPFRTVDGRDYVTLWTGDIVLPDTVKTIPGPDRSYDFIRSVLYDDMVKAVEGCLPRKKRMQ